MAVLVNPPPQLKIPAQFLKDPATRSFFEQTNVILFQLRNQAVADNSFITESFDFNKNGFGPHVQFLQKQINGLPELTIDTSGFTTDLTFITTDKVIA